MPGWDLLFAFATATIVFAVMPGPALIYTAAQTLARGRSGGFWAALGLHAGGLVHVAGAALGLSALFTLLPPLYLALKIIGALYLIYIGLRLILSRSELTLPVETTQFPDSKRAFMQSVLVEVLNPKTALFFIAFLPQFIDPMASLPVWGQMLILGLVVNLAFSGADIAAVLLTSAILRGLKKGQKTITFARWAGGGVLAALGIHLLLAER